MEKIETSKIIIIRHERLGVFQRQIGWIKGLLVSKLHAGNSSSYHLFRDLRDLEIEISQHRTTYHDFMPTKHNLVSITRRLVGITEIKLLRNQNIKLGLDEFVITPILNEISGWDATDYLFSFDRYP